MKKKPETKTKKVKATKSVQDVAQEVSQLILSNNMHIVPIVRASHKYDLVVKVYTYLAGLLGVSIKAEFYINNIDNSTK